VAVLSLMSATMHSHLTAAAGAAILFHVQVVIGGMIGTTIYLRRMEEQAAEQAAFLKAAEEARLRQEDG